MPHNKLQGYALPLALILVAVFSIIIANIGPRSNIYNSSQNKVIEKFKLDQAATETYINNKLNP
jgi:hypothetical protein